MVVGRLIAGLLLHVNTEVYVCAGSNDSSHVPVCSLTPSSQSDDDREGRSRDSYTLCSSGCQKFVNYNRSTPHHFEAHPEFNVPPHPHGGNACPR